VRQGGRHPRECMQKDSFKSKSSTLRNSQSKLAKALKIQRKRGND
jgi:hypothetical protein